jgi:hypothetical protein
MPEADWWLCPRCRSLNNLPAGKCFACRLKRPRGAPKASEILGYTPRVSWDGKVSLEAASRADTAASLRRALPLRIPERRSILSVAPRPPAGARATYHEGAPPVERWPIPAPPVPMGPGVPMRPVPVPGYPMPPNLPPAAAPPAGPPAAWDGHAPMSPPPSRQPPPRTPDAAPAAPRADGPAVVAIPVGRPDSNAIPGRTPIDGHPAIPVDAREAWPHWSDLLAGPDPDAKRKAVDARQRVATQAGVHQEHPLSRRLAQGGRPPDRPDGSA